MKSSRFFQIHANCDFLLKQTTVQIKIQIHNQLKLLYILQQLNFKK